MKKETIIKMAKNLGYDVNIMGIGNVYLHKNSKTIYKKGYIKTYRFLYYQQKKIN